jgi:hypothetical protein
LRWRVSFHSSTTRRPRTSTARSRSGSRCRCTSWSGCCNRSLGDYLLFAGAATIAICTKDQAYAVYIAAPFLIVAAEWRRSRSRRVERPLASAVLNRRLGAAAAVAALIFVCAHNLLFNFSGFVRHVRYITGAGSEGYRMFAPTAAGRLQLLMETLRLDRISWGWPLFAASAAGLVVAWRPRSTRVAALALTAIVLSYYFGFIDVILYNYDRFLFPVFVIQAVFIGVACDRALAAAGRPFLVVLVAVFSYSLVYASTVDILMARDSRYDAARWMDAHVGHGALVATMFPPQYLPRLDGVAWAVVRSSDELRHSGAGFYVLNADYARALEPNTEPAELVNSLQRESIGYVLAARFRSAAPWPWLPWGHPDLVGPRLQLPVVSVLRNINPAIEIYRRKPAP